MAITLPVDLAARVAAEAARRGVSVEELVAEVLDARLPREAPEQPAGPRLKSSADKTAEDVVEFDVVEEASLGSFPASDPPGWWAGPPRG